MNFDTTTFVFEILNFLVLLWLLHRFLYRPILAVIDRRQADIEQRLAEARKVREEAAALEQSYRDQLSGLEREHSEARLRLEGELQLERSKGLAQLQAELDRERERRRSLDVQRDRERAAQAEQAGLRLATQFLTRLLERLAGPELDAKLLATALEDLRALPEASRETIGRALQDHAGAVKVETAYPVSGQTRQSLVAVLSEVTGRPIRCEFAETPELLAGLRMSAGHWVLSANLLEELKYFEDAGRESRTRTQPR
ncbi:MAG TPA: F0F1 ATP synthase subunit delta [bacterium]|nr:F0F1 ATP synthase subunit delta [bacterium]